MPNAYQRREAIRSERIKRKRLLEHDQILRRADSALQQYEAAYLARHGVKPKVTYERGYFYGAGRKAIRRTELLKEANRLWAEIHAEQVRETVD